MPEIDKWVDGLSGRSKEAPDDAVILRNAFLDSEAVTPVESSVVPEQELRFQTLMRRLRDEGLLAENKTTAPVREKGFWPLVFSSAFALVLIAAVGITLFLDPTEMLFPHQSENFDLAPRYRGLVEATENNTLNSVEAMADLVDQLDRYSIPYKLSEKSGQWLLTFYVADNLSTDASVWLESMSLRITPMGWAFILLEERKAQ